MPSTPVQSVTTAPVSPRVERAGRTRRYLVMMAVRTACFLLAFVVEGWARWLCVALAVLLPYVAVVLANAVGPRGAVDAVPPGGPAGDPPRLEAR